MVAPMRVAVIGAGLAGQGHAAAYRAASTVYNRDLPPVQLAVIADSNVNLAESVAARYGYERAVSSWQEVASATDIDAVSVVVHNALHREIAEKLLTSGKHVLCEKPLAPSVEDAQAMVAQAQTSGHLGRVGFSYRRSPAFAALREVILRGDLGRPLHIAGRYLGDYAADENAPMGWRFKGPWGSGVLADLGSHLVDFAEQLCGRAISASGAKMSTVITKRPVPLTVTTGHSAGPVGTEFEPVENEDYAQFGLQFADTNSSSLGSFHTSRIARGHPNTLSFEIACEFGSGAYDQRRPGEFQLWENSTGGSNSGYRTVLVGPDHPYLDGGLAMSYPGVGVGTNENFVFQARAFLEEIAGIENLPRCASFEEGLHNLEVLDAVVRSDAQSGAISPVDSNGENK
ncbi:MAG: Gfo/Idh/MocA family oxidoreductase [Cryobacterium sp.]|nr:Gfo/Idh/MocA family oxidoreductase [Cryobacterium sp.]